jgi:hypothetical protein
VKAVIVSEDAKKFEVFVPLPNITVSRRIDEMADG